MRLFLYASADETVAGAWRSGRGPGWPCYFACLSFSVVSLSTTDKPLKPNPK
jgi:hypothetical protein